MVLSDLYAMGARKAALSDTDREERAQVLAEYWSLSCPPELRDLCHKDRRADSPGNLLGLLPLTPDAVTCADSLLTTATAPLPDHVCYFIAMTSVKRYALRHYLPRPPTLSTPITPLLLWLLLPVPLPVGERSMGHFIRDCNQDPHMRRLIGRPTRRADLPPPLVPDRPEAEVLVWVERNLPEGMVRLLGLVENPAGENDLVRAIHGAWRFGEPRMLTERRVRVQGKRGPDPLRDLERQLDRWYRQHVLGAEVGATGRPTGLMLDRQTFMAHYEQATMGCVREDIKPTYKAVALKMLLAESTVRKYVREWEAPPPLAMAAKAKSSRSRR